MHALAVGHDAQHRGAQLISQDVVLASVVQKSLSPWTLVAVLMWIRAQLLAGHAHRLCRVGAGHARQEVIVKGDVAHGQLNRPGHQKVLQNGHEAGVDDGHKEEAPEELAALPPLDIEGLAHQCLHLVRAHIPRRARPHVALAVGAKRWRSAGAAAVAAPKAAGCGDGAVDVPVIDHALLFLCLGRGLLALVRLGQLEEDVLKRGVAHAPVCQPDARMLATLHLLHVRK